MPASRVVYYDKEGNEQIFIGNPKNAPRDYGKQSQKNKQGGKKTKLALKGGGRAYGRNS